MERFKDYIVLPLIEKTLKAGQQVEIVSKELLAIDPDMKYGYIQA
jgi:hypothetical protein